MESHKTAAFLVIGSEILSGQIKDDNTEILAKTFFNWGLQLEKTETVPDRHKDIQESALRLSKQYDYVLTSGGIGPTHDDITYEALAQVFGRSLEHHLPTLKKLEAYYQLHYPTHPINEARKRMVLLPKPCQVFELEGFWVPLVCVENVYIYPGVPQLFEGMLLASEFIFHGNPKLFKTRAYVYTDFPEGHIADLLTQAQKNNPSIAIGSYPSIDSKDSYAVKISIEGFDAKKVTEVAQYLHARLSQEGLC